MRRIAFPAAFLLFLSIAAGIFAPARAQDATPIGGGLTGYPKLSVTITDTGFDLSPASVPAGFVILSITNSTGEDTGAGVIGPPPGMDADAFAQLASTPVPSDVFPEWAYTAVFPGGPNSIPPGKTLEAIVNLPAGDWAIIGEGTQPPTRFTAVTGTDSITTEPAATASIELGDFYFGGLDEALPAGPQLIKITNSGKQPHMVVLGKGPDTMTMDQLMAVIASPEDATPAPGGLTDADFVSIPGVFLLSSGQTVYLSENLVPGTYAALCFVTDPATGAPHAMEGMATTFTVA